MMFFRKTILLLLTFCAVSFTGMAQKANGVTEKTKHASGLLQNNGFFTHLDVGATLGTTGLGIDVATNLGEYVQMRAGFSYMPRFEMTSSFRVQVGDSLDNKYDKQGNRVQTKFDKLSGVLKSMVGYDIDDEIDMTCKPSYYNFKLLFDVFPFPDKRWHVTAGFFLGSSEVGRAYNKTEEMPSLLSVSMWNMLYHKAYYLEPLYDNIYMPVALEDKLLQYGKMGFHAGDYTHDGPFIPVDPESVSPIDRTASGDPIYAYDEENLPIYIPVKADANGKAIRAYKKGDPYMMVPDETSGMVKAYIKANRFKPYVGFGYGGAISKDKLTQLSFDAGVMFWGGRPSMVTHDGTDLVRDVENVRGKVGRYVDTAKFFKVFPMIEVRISRRIF